MKNVNCIHLNENEILCGSDKLYLIDIKNKELILEWKVVSSNPIGSVFLFDDYLMASGQIN